MLRIIFISLTFFLLQAPVIYAEDFVTKDEIIKRLGGASATEKIPTVRTRSIGIKRKIDRSVKVVPKDKHFSEYHKHIVVRLLFKYNSTDFSDHRSDQQLAHVGLALQSSELSHIQVEIGGHTCDLGSDEYNLNLSRRRAERVRNDLIQFYRIKPRRLVVVGYGERLPHEPNDLEVNRRLNRRVVIKRLE